MRTRVMVGVAWDWQGKQQPMSERRGSRRLGHCIQELLFGVNHV